MSHFSPRIIAYIHPHVEPWAPFHHLGSEEGEQSWYAMHSSFQASLTCYIITEQTVRVRVVYNEAFVLVRTPFENRSLIEW